MRVFSLCLAKKGGWARVWPCRLTSGDSFENLNQGARLFPRDTMNRADIPKGFDDG